MRYFKKAEQKFHRFFPKDRLIFLCVIVFFMGLHSCFHLAKKPSPQDTSLKVDIAKENLEEASKNLPGTKAEVAEEKELKLVAPVIPPVTVVIPLKQEEPCYPFLDLSLPAYIKELGVVITRFEKECVTGLHQLGRVEGSGVIAMAIPCTGGDGKIEILGNYNNPKTVRFIIGNDCAVKNFASKKIKEVMSSIFSENEEVKMLAVNPFAVQFWEIENIKDSSVGFMVELRSDESLKKLWPDFIHKQTPIAVKLFGRENSWTDRTHMFSVDAQIVYSSRKKFRLEPRAIHLMTDELVSAARFRCQALKPQRPCFNVFTN